MMRRLFLSLAILACLPEPRVCGQAVPNVPWMNPWERRMLRDKAVAYAGPIARPLVESAYGDLAAFALLRCSQRGAATLASFHNCGGLSRIPRAGDLLYVIAQPNGGDGVCLYAIQHANALAYPQCCNAFLTAPLDFVYGFRQLPVPLAGRGFSPASPSWSSSSSFYGRYDERTWTWGAGFAGLVVFLIWRKRRRLARDLPA